MVLEDAPSLLTSLCENEESDKLLVKADCDFEHNIVVVSKDILIEEKYLLAGTPLETLMMSHS